MAGVLAWREGGERGRPPGEQSRSRLFHLGAQALTDREVLELVLGERGGLPEPLLTDGLRAIAQQEPLDLAEWPGVGQARAARLLAAFELGRRLLRPSETRPRLKTPRQIFEFMAPQLVGCRREVFHVLCLNAANVLLRDVRVAEGSGSTCPVDPREVFAAALRVRACAIVLVHNHPSGDPEPSEPDVALTRILVDAARFLGIAVLDHVVVGDGQYASLLEKNLMPRPERGLLERSSR